MSVSSSLYIQNASTSSAPIFAWMEECYKSNSSDILYPDVPPVRKGLLA